MNEFTVKLDTIGEMANWAIKLRCIETRMRKNELYKLLDMSSAVCTNWKRGTIPDGYHLQQMALNGFDVHWILTGVRADGSA